jgi:hypothetical protein
MATAAYLTGRRRYQRPQAILWSENSGTLVSTPTLENPDLKVYVPNGYEVGADTGAETDTSLFDQFMILSDHNRADMQFNMERIEQRQRTINGRMRSYHIADKLSMSVSWNMLPSRSHDGVADFDESGISLFRGTTGEYTADGGAGGAQLLDWYQNHQGPFWMYLAYDKYTNFGNDDLAFSHLTQYTQIMQVYITDFSYTVVARGGSNHDLWNISVTLEEV